MEKSLRDFINVIYSNKRNIVNVYIYNTSSLIRKIQDL